MYEFRYEEMEEVARLAVDVEIKKDKNPEIIKELKKSASFGIIEGLKKPKG